MGLRLLVKRLTQKDFQRCAKAYLAAFFTCSGTHVHQPVGAGHGLHIVFDDHYRIALVPKFLQRRYQFPVVFLVKTDGRLVQDVQHANEFRTNLGGQTDPLALSSGKGTGRPVQSQVVESYVKHESYPLVQFLEDITGYVVLPISQFCGQG